MYRLKLPFTKTLSFLLLVGIVFGGFPTDGWFAPEVAEAAFNKQINYQGKLTNNSNIAVSDGSYNIRFKLYTAASGGSPIWTETWCYSTDSGATCTGSGTDGRIVVSNGLFSTLLGSTTSLAGIDFNQTLYLGVEIGGGASTPSWDGEMAPRKKLGAVPAAITAENVGGLNNSQFIRSDAANSTSSASTYLSITQSGAGKIAEFFTAGSASVLSVTSGGLVGIGTTSPYSMLSVAGQIVASNFVGTTTATSTFGGNLAINGTGTSTSAGGINLTAGCFSVGGTCVGGGSSLGYPFALIGNATSTLTQFNGGLTAYASSTIGDGTIAGGLTVSGSATTSGNIVLNGTTSNYLKIFTNTTGTKNLSGWNIFEGFGGFYDGYLHISTSTPGGNLPAVQITDTGNLIGNYGYSVRDGQSVASDSSGSLAYYKPYTGTQGELYFRGASNSPAIFKISSYWHNGSFNNTDVAYFRTDSSGAKVGIGSSTPWAKLSVNPVAGDYGPMFAIGSSSATYFMVASSTGYVGIGTTTPGAQLHVGTLNGFAVYPNWAGSGELPSAGTLFGSYTGNLSFFADTFAGAVGKKVTFGYYDGSQNRSALEVANTTGGTFSNLLLMKSGGNVGIGTTSPYAPLSVLGQVVASYFTGTTTATSTFGGNLAINGTGTSTSAGGINLSAGCFSIGGTCLSSGSSSGYPFALTGNATSTLTQFNGGLTAYASSTIGAGGQTTGLTISGGATTTGSMYVAGNVGVGTPAPLSKLHIVQASGGDGLFITGTGYSGTPSSSNGVKIAVGHNQANAAQLWIGDASGFGSSAKSVFRYIAGTTLIAGIDAVYGDGSTRAPVNIGTDTSDVAIGNSGSLAYNAALPAKLSLYAEASKVGLNIGGASGQSGNYFNITSDGGAAGNIFNVKSSGNVGIGTTSPYAMLSVAGQVVASYFTGTSTATSTVAGGFEAWRQLATPYFIASSTTATSTIAGNLMIGTTTRSEAQLYIDQSRNYPALVIRRFSGSSANAFEIQGADGTRSVYYDNNNTSWNVPGIRLGNGGDGMYFNTSLAARSDFALQWSGTTNATASKDSGLKRLSAGVLGVTDGGTGGGALSANYFTATSSTASTFAGSVGIGTTSPFQTLSVAGSTFTQSLSLAGNYTAATGQAYIPSAVGTASQGQFIVSPTTGTGAIGAFQGLDTGAVSYTFFASNRFYTGSDWGGNSRAGSSFQLQDDSFTFYSWGAGQVGSANAVSRLTVASGGKVGIGTTSPYAPLSVVGQIVGAYFTGTTTATSTFGGNLAINGTGTSTSAGGINLTAGCFSIGGTCVGGGSGSSVGYPFALTGNATSTLTQFNGGLTAYASSTIGDSTGPGGLTVSGDATTTRNVYLATSDNSTVSGSTGPRGVRIGAPNPITSSLPNAQLQVSRLFGQSSTSFDQIRVIGSGGKIGGVTDWSGFATTSVNSFDTSGLLVYGLKTDVSEILNNYVAPGAYGVYSTARTGGDNSSGLAVGGYFSAVSTGSGKAYGLIVDQGNAGFGTTSPYAKLSVVGQIVASYYTATTSATSTFAGGIQTNLLNVTSATASSTFANGINLTAGCFSVGGTCVGGGSSLGYPFALTGNATSTLTQFNGGLTAYASSTIGSGSQIGGLTISGGATTTGSMYVAGNVGIGNASPLTKLDILGTSVTDASGNIRSSASNGYSEWRATNNAGTASDRMAFGVGGTATGDLYQNKGYLLTSDNLDGLLIQAAKSSGIIQMFTGGSLATNERLRIDSTGKVGIGTTSPYAKLSVVGPVVAEYFAATSTTATSTFAGGVTAGYTTGGSSGLSVLQNGYVGINTTAPTALLHIFGGSNNQPASAFTVVGGKVGTTGPGQTIVLTTGQGGNSSFVTAGGVGGDFSLSVGSGGNNLGGGGPGGNAGTITIAGANGGNGSGAVGGNGSSVYIYGGLGGSGTPAGVNGSIVLGMTAAGLVRGNVGIGTTSPYAPLSVLGEIVGSYFTGTTTATSTFGGNLAINGTGTSTSAGGINLTAGCFSVGGTCVGGGGSFSNTLANGGTATTTFYSGGVVYSDGTKLTQSSAEANFFWDETNKRLGIGTSTPWALLSINSPTGATAPQFVVGSSTVTNFMVAMNGNVGVGTTSPFAKFSVLGGPAATINAQQVAFAAYGAPGPTGGSGQHIILSAGNAGSVNNINGGNVTISAGNGSSGNDGNGGLILLTPGIGGGAGAVGKIGVGSTTPWGYFSINPTALGSGVPEFVIGSSSATRFIVTGGGNIGIGTTSPWAKLSVANGSLATTPLFALSTSTASATSTAFLVDSNGKVGIGTTTPYAQLSVSGLIAGSSMHANDPLATSTFAGGINANNGTFVSDFSTGITSIGGLELGNLSFDTDAGIVSWVDLPILSAAAGVIQSYTANIAGNPLLTVYGESNGSAGLQNGRVAIGTSSPYARFTVWGSGTGTGRLVDFINSASTSQMTLLDNGLLGLGSTTPWATLSVNSVAGTDPFAVGSSTGSYLRISRLGEMILGTTTAGCLNTTATGLVYAATCAGGGGSGTVNSGVFGQVAFFGANGTAVSGTTTLVVGTTTVDANNVGVGTSTPYAQLSVSSSAGKTAFAIGSSTGTSFIVGPTGNVGIGTTSPWMKLSVSLPTSASYDPAFLLQNLDTTGVTQQSFMGSGTGAREFRIGVGNASEATGYANKFFVYDNTSGGPRMIIDTVGFVGFGTTTPSAVVHAVGSTTATGYFVNTATPSAAGGAGMSAYSYLTPTATGQRLGFLVFGSLNGTTASNNGAAISAFSEGAWTANSSIPSYLTFETTPASSVARTERMRINSVGNISIGTTTPFARLSIAATSTATNIPLFGIQSPTPGAIGTTTLFMVDANGNTGIGSSTPWASLAVNPLAGRAANQFVIGSSTATNFIVTNAGRVGIGTAAPSVPLEVNGNALIAGTMTSIYTASQSFSANNGQNGYNASFSNTKTGSYTSGVAFAGGGNIASQNVIYGTFDKTTGFNTFVELTPTYNLPGGTATNTDLMINRTQTAIGTGRQYLIDAQVAGITKFNVTNAGFLGLSSTTPWGLVSINPTLLGSGVPEFVIGSSSATRLIVTGAGQVGIGTSTPTANLLSVAGDMYIGGSGTNSTSTIQRNLNVLQNLKVGSGTGLTLVGNATSTFGAGGINVTSGCFAIAGTCIGGGGSTNSAGGTGAIQFANGTSFDADASNFFWDNSNKRLGIGTNAPGNAVTVRVNSVGDGFYVDASGGNSPQFGISDTGNVRFSFGYAMAAGHYSNLANAGDSIIRNFGYSGGALRIANEQQGSIVFEVDPDTFGNQQIASVDGNGFHIASGKNYYSYTDTVGADCSDNSVNVEGGLVVGCGTYSDERLKNNIQDMPSVLSFFNEITPKTFNYSELGADLAHTSATATQYGLIAQDLAAMGAPYNTFVSTSSTGFLSVNYGKFIPILIEAVKEINLKVDMFTSTSTASSTMPTLRSVVASVFDSFGATIEQGIVKVKSMFVENLAVGTKEKPAGITLYDQVTGEPYCLSVKNGSMQSISGDCTTQLSQNNQQTGQSSSGDTLPIIINTDSSTTTATTTPSTDSDAATSTPSTGTGSTTPETTGGSSSQVVTTPPPVNPDTQTVSTTEVPPTSSDATTNS